MQRNTRLLATMMAVTLAGSPVSAQDPVAVGGPPVPGSTNRYRLTLTSDVASGRGEAATADSLSERSKGSVTFVVREEVGDVDEDGDTPVFLTFERITFEGKHEEADEFARLADQTVGVWIDKQGDITHIASRKAVDALAGPLTALLPQRFDSLPRRDMRIGESVELPFAMPSFLPALGDGPLGVIGESRLTLVKVASEGRERVATLREQMEGKVDTTDGPPGLRVRMTVRGTTTSRTSLTTRLLMARTREWSAGATVYPPGGAAPVWITAKKQVLIEPLT